MTKKSYTKFVATAATATLVASAIAPVAASADSKQFTDVNERYAPAVDYVVSKGVQGKTSTQFGVQDSIKRVDAAVFIANALDLNKPGSPDAGFSDVPARAKDAVNALKAKGIINGKTDTRYGANDVLTRGEVALILASAYNLKGDANSVKFTDVNKNRYGSAVAGLVDAGVTDGISDTKFGTENPVKRGDLAVFLYKLSGETPEVPSTDGITSVKAINDTRVEVTFGKAIEKDFIREAELNGKYFAVYTEGNSVQSNSTVQSTAINFSADGKTATFDLRSSDAIESGKKYNVALLDSDNNKVADVLYTYGPAVLKEAAQAPNFEVSAKADKIFVKYNTKMKDSAKTVANYSVYDEGGKKLGDLSEFVTGDGEWVNFNSKNEVEFTLDSTKSKKLLAGKTYKLVVTANVKTDDNKSLSETDRTIKVTTPSITEASPEAKVARVKNSNTIELVFDKEITLPTGSNITLNPAQLDLRTSTGKTVTVDTANLTKKQGANNTLVITLTGDALEKGTTYNVDFPANVVNNGLFPNAANKSTSNLVAKAQDNVSIKTMSAQIVQNDKNSQQADLVLTFDQVPLIDSNFNVSDIQLFDGRDEYKLPSNATVKVYGKDDSGKSIIIENISQYKNDKKGELVVRGDKTYDVEIKENKLSTDSFDNQKATNKDKLKASTSGIAISAPVVDEIRLQSSEKIEVDFKENISGDFDPADLTINAFVANRSDLMEVKIPTKVSGAGFYDVSVSGKTLTITAKKGVKFPTSVEGTNPLTFEIADGAIANASGSAKNLPIKSEDYKGDTVDNAAPEIINVEAKGSTGKEVEVTFSENITTQSFKSDDIATLFFTDKGENASEGVKFNGGSTNKATITFKDVFWTKDTDLSIVTLEHKAGNSFYIQDKESNKMVTHKVTGFTSATGSTPSVPEAIQELSLKETKNLEGKVAVTAVAPEWKATVNKDLTNIGDKAEFKFNGVTITVEAHGSLTGVTDATTKTGAKVYVAASSNAAAVANAIKTGLEAVKAKDGLKEITVGLSNAELTLTGEESIGDTLNTVKVEGDAVGLAVEPTTPGVTAVQEQKRTVEYKVEGKNFKANEKVKFTLKVGNTTKELETNALSANPTADTVAAAINTVLGTDDLLTPKYSVTTSGATITITETTASNNTEEIKLSVK